MRWGIPFTTRDPIGGQEEMLECVKGDLGEWYTPDDSPLRLFGFRYMILISRNLVCIDLEVHTLDYWEGVVSPRLCGLTAHPGFMDFWKCHKSEILDLARTHQDQLKGDEI